MGSTQSMLRIQRSATADTVVFTLSGRIRVEDLAELQRVFAFEGQKHCVVLDLKEVKLVDRDAVRFLAHYEAKGTTLQNCPVYIREWMRRETEAIR
jgi:anti-anti-sigma regulatory factor